jgi:hypothetical protein
MRLRQGVQREVEQAASQLGMPTRTEIDAAHRRIAELERALRRMRDGAGAKAEPAGHAGGKPTAKKAAAGTPAKAPAKKRATTKRAGTAGAKAAGKAR